MNMVVENLALGTFHNMATATTCDTLRTILQMVLRDESRHVAFGHVYVSSRSGPCHVSDVVADSQQATSVASFRSSFMRGSIRRTFSRA